ncbi:CBS domain-containing protein [Streptomyces sp. NPDC020731]|uniref:CBS domain-containing protein n=1 Tax=Streptomyces sp. NPDC020731 TaxID=3365085 RepID=UPI003798A39E
MAEFVKDVMTAGVVAVRPDASIVEAARLTRTQNIGDVVGAGGQRVVGVLTDRDITVRAVARGADPLGMSAGSMCAPDPLALAPDDPVSSAVALMREHAIRRIPVVEGGLPVGPVSLGDPAEAREPGSAPAGIGHAEPDRNS